MLHAHNYILHQFPHFLDRDAALVGGLLAQNPTALLHAM